MSNNFSPEQQTLNLPAAPSVTQDTTEEKPVIRQPQNLFIDAAPRPTISGPGKIRYDFNYGCRVELPRTDLGKKWKIRYTDMLTSNIIFETEKCFCLGNRFSIELSIKIFEILLFKIFKIYPNNNNNNHNKQS